MRLSQFKSGEATQDNGSPLEEVMSLLPLLIQLISGAVGGNVAGAAMKQYDLGTLGNSIAGIVGGGIGGQLIAALIPALANAAQNGSLDLGAIAGQVAGGGVGGGILLVVVGLIKQMMAGGAAK
jgi:hypothetical protein